MLNVNDLQNVAKSRKEREKKTYKIILQDCYKKIKLRNEHGQTKVVFSVPVFMYDSPLYNINDAIKYIVKKLRKGGFRVYVSDNTLSIDWTKKQ